jgi:hypothetical protein
MLPFAFGAFVGAFAAVVLALAYVHIRGIKVLFALLGTILVSMLPRAYFIYTGNDEGELLYVLAWMLVVSAGFYYLAFSSGRRFLVRPR